MGTEITDKPTEGELEQDFWDEVFFGMLEGKPVNKAAAEADEAVKLRRASARRRMLEAVS